MLQGIFRIERNGKPSKILPSSNLIYIYKEKFTILVTKNSTYLRFKSVKLLLLFYSIISVIINTSIIIK